MDNFLTNTLSIDIQPKQNFHFRYVSELKNTHGAVTGQLQHPYRQPQNSVPEDTYPTVRLQLPHDGHLDEFGNKRDFFILCSLHSYDDNRPKSLSPHLLMEKGNKTPSYNFIFEKMMENSKDPLERSWELKDHVIVRLKPNEYQHSLNAKRRHYESLKLSLEFDRLKGDLDMNYNKSSGILNVCLGFTIFERDFYTDEYRLYKETIYSDNIFHGDDLRIHELCNTKGPIAGGTKIHILIKLQSGYKYFVRMFKHNSDMTDVVWEEFVPLTNDDIFSNAAITYALPAGPTNLNIDEIDVMIEIVVGRSTYKSKAVKFCYVNTSDNESGRRKRPRTIEEGDASTSTSSTKAVVTEVKTLPNLTYAIDPNLMHSRSPQLQMMMPRIDPNLQDTITNFEMDFSTLLGAQFLVTPNSFNTNTLDFADVDVSQFVQGTEQSFSPATSHNEEDVQSLISEYLQLSDGRNNVSGERRRYSSDRCVTIVTKKEKIKAETSPPPKNSTNSDKSLIKRRIEQIVNEMKTLQVKDINIQGLNVKSGNTIFHDALVDMDTLLYLYRQQKKYPQLNELILKARNPYRQNLLHYACVRDKPLCIRPLVGMGVALNEQDSQGRTPLHIAIESNKSECLQKIQNLLEDHSEYPPKVDQQLVKMFQVYSHKGHTVLHAAVIEHVYDLVEVMLKFCTSRNLDILQYEALGNGDSIVHLMVKRNLLDMITLIRSYVPQYLTVENYRGQTVLDVPELSTEMSKALVALDVPELSKSMFQALKIK